LTNSNNIILIEKFKTICKRHCDIIETSLLDFEKYSISDLLRNVANSINQIRLAATAGNIQNAIQLANSMQSAISYAIDEKIELFGKDIDILLRSNDLFYSTIQFDGKEVLDLFEFEEVIINEYISDCKKIIAPYRIKSSPAKTEQKIELNDEISKESQTILLEKFKFELVKNTFTIESALGDIQSDSEEIDIVPVSQALNTIKGAAISAGIEKAFELADSMQEFISYCADNNIPINSYQMELLFKCNNLFKQIAAGSAIALIDKFNDYSDFIDNYSNFLNNFLADGGATPQLSESSKLLKDDMIFNSEDEFDKKIISTDKPFFFGYKTSNFKSKEQYDRLLESVIQITANLSQLYTNNNLIKELKMFLREAQLAGNDILFNITNTELITKSVFEINEKLNSIISEIDRNILFSSRTLDKIKINSEGLYSSLYQMRSMKFGDIIIGFNELSNDLANYSRKKVKLKLLGRFVRVGAEAAPILEIVLPQILRHIIVANIEEPSERKEQNKPEIAEIIISARFVSGRLIIEFSDDGNGDEANLQANSLERLVGFISNNKGRIEINSEAKVGSQIQITFELDFILLKSLVFELAGNQYAVLLADSEGLISIDGEFEYNDKSFKIIDMRRVLNLKDTYFAKAKPAILINQYSMTYALQFDKFLNEADLVPSKANGLFGKNPLISATSIYNDAPVIILNINKLLDSQQ